MPRITVKRGRVKQAGGISAWLDQHIGLRDGVELVRVKDQGMHGSRSIIWDTPDGRTSCSAYYSSPPVATVKMSVSTYGLDPDREDDDRQPNTEAGDFDQGVALFGIPAHSDELNQILQEADRGFD